MNRNLRTIAVLATAIVLFAACKKSDDNNNSNPATASFTLKGNTYRLFQGTDATGVDFFGHTSYVLGATGKTDDGTKYAGVDVISLANIRPTAGSYNIGGFDTAYSTNQLQLLAVDSSAAGHGLYSSDLATNVNATVTVTNGKVSVTVPAITLRGSYAPTTGDSYIDSIVLAGTIAVQ